MRNRTGFTLIHLMLVLPLLAAVMVLWTGVFRMSMMETPRIERAHTARHTAEAMLERIHADVLSATAVETFEEAPGGTLKLTVDGEPVTYRWQRGIVTRTGGSAPQPAPGDVTTWTLPGGHLKLRVLEVRNASAVEAEFFIHVRLAGKETEALRTKHLWFVGGAKEAGR
jgi:hypothetical protein